MPSNMAHVNGTRTQDVHQNVGPGVQNNNCGPGTQYIAENINWIGEIIAQVRESSLTSPNFQTLMTETVGS